MYNLRYDDYVTPPFVRCDSMEPDFCYAERPVRRAEPCDRMPPCGCRRPMPPKGPCKKPCEPKKCDGCCLLAVLIVILI